MGESEQLDLGIVPPAESQPHIEKPRLVAFGGFVKPGMYDVFGDYDLEAVTLHELAWVTPEKFGSILFEPPRKAKMVVDNVAINPFEHRLISRWPSKLIESAISKTLGDNDLNDERLAAADRSGIHVLERKLEPMEEHVGKLQLSRQDVSQLKKEARTPGFAHIPEERMKEILGVTWLEFTTILDVAHVQRGWTDDRRARAEAALVKYLADGPQRQRVAHWQGMIDLADNYLGARIILFNSRIRQTREVLNAKPDELA